MQQSTRRSEPLAVSFKEAAKITGLSESHLRKLAREQAIESTKHGRRRLVSYESLQSLVHG